MMFLPAKMWFTFDFMSFTCIFIVKSTLIHLIKRKGGDANVSTFSIVLNEGYWE
jgi:hypothetical protein